MNEEEKLKAIWEKVWNKYKNGTSFDLEIEMIKAGQKSIADELKKELPVFMKENNGTSVWNIHKIIDNKLLKKEYEEQKLENLR